jgi:hypothetical protein
MTAAIPGVFWNLAMRTFMAEIMVLTSCGGTGWFSVESMQASAFPSNKFLKSPTPSEPSTCAKR